MTGRTIADVLKKFNRDMETVLEIYYTQGRLSVNGDRIVSRYKRLESKSIEEMRKEMQIGEHSPEFKKQQKKRTQTKPRRSQKQVYVIPAEPGPSAMQKITGGLGAVLRFRLTPILLLGAAIYFTTRGCSGPQEDSNVNDNLPVAADSILASSDNNLNDILPVDVEPTVRLTDMNRAIPVDTSKISGKIFTAEDLESKVNNGVDYVRVEPGLYEIRDNLQVHYNTTVDIAPGTTFRFGPNSGILSFGSINAVGKPDSLITFSALSTQWSNITLAGQYASDSKFEYCEFNAGRGRNPKISANERFPGNKIDKDDPLGGALMLVQSGAKISNCTFSGNNTNDGGAIAILESNTEIYSNLFESNYAKDYGGAIYTVDNENPQSINITDNEFVDNGALKGGSIHTVFNIPRIEGNTFSGSRLFNRWMKLPKGIDICLEMPIPYEKNTIQTLEENNTMGEYSQPGYDTIDVK